MKFGIIPINIGVSGLDELVGRARLAEEVGIESVWTFEHVIVPEDYQSKYPYNKSGKMGAEPETVFIDPLIALTAIASATKTVRLGTGVNILPQVNPLLLAKQAASLDYLSGGRFMLGAGIGWLREEFHAMGVPFGKRGARFDDYVTAMKKVWSGETVEHESEFLDWHGFKSYPRPVQKPTLPVHIGGNKGKAFERIAKYGAGWYAPTGNPEELKPQLEQMAEECRKIGRDPAEIEVTAMWPMKGGLDFVKQMEDLGVYRLNVPTLAISPADQDSLIKKLGDEIIAKV